LWIQFEASLKRKQDFHPVRPGVIRRHQRRSSCQQATIHSFKGVCGGDYNNQDCLKLLVKLVAAVFTFLVQPCCLLPDITCCGLLLDCNTTPRNPQQHLTRDREALGTLCGICVAHNLILSPRHPLWGLKFWQTPVSDVLTGRVPVAEIWIPRPCTHRPLMPR